MAFGSGALLSALSFELMGEAYRIGGVRSTAIGFIAGAVIFSALNLLLSRCGAKHRKRSNLNNRLGAEATNYTALAIAIGALIDGIPESLVIGIGMMNNGTVSMVTVAAVFISNLPEGLSSSVGMKNNDKKLGYVLGIWGSIALICPIFSVAGYFFSQNITAGGVAMIMAVGAGAILAMLADTMIPEAFEETHNFAGLITVAGFLSAFVLDKI
jgi:ZIP family zinc transporter